MTAKLIRELAALLPQNCGYVTRNPGRFFSVNYVIEACVDDPRFGWNFVNAFVQTKQPLPAQVFNPELRRTYYHLNFGEADEAVQAAIARDCPWQNVQRYVLNALLMCTDIEIPEIAQVLGLSEEAVRIYDQLFLNARDRLSDAIYIARLVYPMGYIPPTKDDLDREDPGQRFLRAAFEYGKKEVFHMAGLARPQSGSAAVDKLAAEFERETLARGITAQRHGSSNSPELKHAKDLVLARMKVIQPEQTVPAKGLEALSISHGIMDTLLAIQAEDIQRRIYLPDESKPPPGGKSS